MKPLCTPLPKFNGATRRDALTDERLGRGAAKSSMGTWVRWTPEKWRGKIRCIWAMIWRESQYRSGGKREAGNQENHGTTGRPEAGRRMHLRVKTDVGRQRELQLPFKQLESKSLRQWILESLPTGRQTELHCL